MQTSVRASRPSGAIQPAPRAASRRSVAVRAHQGLEFVKDLGKNAAVAAAVLALTMVRAIALMLVVSVIIAGF